MVEGKFLENIFGGKGEERSATASAETLEEDVKRDLKLLEERMEDPESLEDNDIMKTLSRLLVIAENNPQVKAKLEEYSQVYKEHQGDIEEEPEYIKNNELYERIFEWSEKQRLGKFYYNKEEPGKRLED